MVLENREPLSARFPINRERNRETINRLWDVLDDPHRLGACPNCRLRQRLGGRSRALVQREHVLPYKNAADFRRIANGLAKAGLTRPELRLPPSQLERE